MVNGGYTGPAATELEPDDDTIFRFLSWWFDKCNHGAIELCWREPATGRWDLVRRFALDDINAAARFAAGINATPGCSVYFRPATVRFELLNTTDSDVVQIPGAWGDCDTAESVLRMLAAEPAPSAQIITGRHPELRAQFDYKLSEPLLIGEWSRHLNRQVHALSGGDGAVVNPSTLMRLPGSIAWPWKPGREPELTEWVTPDGGGGTFTLDGLRAALPAVEAVAAPGRLNGHAGIDGGASELLNPIRHLLEQVKAGPLWHEPLLRLVAMLIARRTPACVIEAMAPSLTRPGYTEAQTVAELRVMIDGALRKGYAPDPGDDDGGTAADDVLDDVMDIQPEKPETFPLFTVADMANMPDPEWLIPGFLVANTLSPVYGPPASYKSFLALHSALCLATGHDWFGRKIVQCDTLYIAAEGAGGMKLRLAAWKQHHGITDIPGFRVVPCAVNLMRADEAKRLVLTVVEEQKASGFNPKLVIIDTLHRSMPGADENTSRDMGVALANCALIQAELGCAVMPVHHSGKDLDRGMRGSNSTLGDTDGVCRITRTDDRVTVFTEKMKDAEDRQTLSLRAIKVQIPAAGSLVWKDSLVLVLDEEPPPKGRAALSDGEAKAKQFLDDLIVAEGVPLPAGSGFPSPVAGLPLLAVRTDRWADECETRGLSVASEKKNRAMVVRRMMQGLLDKDHIATRGGLVWLSQ